MTLVEVAKRAGVSTASVSYVLNNKVGVSKETAEKVRNVMRNLNYKPKNRTISQKYVANGLKTGTIGLVFGGLHTHLSRIPIYAKLMHAIESELSSEGLMMALICVSQSKEFESVNKSKLDGAIYCGVDLEIERKLGIPHVNVLGHPALSTEMLGDHIEPANEKIGMLAAKYLVSRGHKNIAVVNPMSVQHPAIEIRTRVFFEQGKLLGSDAQIFDVPFENKRNALIEGYEECAVVRSFTESFKKMENRPTGIFVPSDGYLATIHNALRLAGMRPGEDIEFIGCNNEEIILDGLFPRPATIDINPDVMAQCCIERLLYRIRNTTNKKFVEIEVQPELVEPYSNFLEGNR